MIKFRATLKKDKNMKAFVKTNNGTFPNLNFYMAWEGFNTMGYSVTLFEEKDIDILDITPETPVFAGVTIFRKVIDKLGINYPQFNCYPDVLKPYYGRDIRISTLGEERRKFDKNPIPVFVKPIKPKEFIGNVWSSCLNLIPLVNKNDDIACYVCEPIKIETEFRVYVHDGEILSVKHYHGKWNVVPDIKFIKEVIKKYKPCPIAYGIDIGVTDTGTSVVVEVNDGCNLGNYGIDSIHYGEMIVSRWFEIMAEHKVENKINAELKWVGEMCKEYPTIVSSLESTRDFYYKPYPGSDYTCKSGMLSEEVKKQRQASMKKFAEESLKEIRENNINYEENADIITEK